MAQAETITDTMRQGILSGRDTASAATKSVYFSLEGSIYDLQIMAKIASEQVFTCVGGLNCVDGEPTEAPTSDNVQAALFATSHVVKMLEKLIEAYEGGIENIKEGLAQ